jgi:polar amino acid transport system substrate-binding protein
MIAYAQSDRPVIKVLAIEYPPFTSSKMTHNGIAFMLLRQYAKKHFIADIQPHIVPPARLQVLLKLKSWCLSFYPSLQLEGPDNFIQLSDSKIKIGMYRKRQNSVFRWDNLNEFSGASIALLRSNKSSRFYQLYTEAGLLPIFVDSIEQGIKLLLKGRIDYAFADNISIDLMDISPQQKESLQFSETIFLETPIQVYLNPSCTKRLYANTGNLDADS